MVLIWFSIIKVSSKNNTRYSYDLRTYKFNFSFSMEKYSRIKIIGEGAHGKVSKYKIQQLPTYHIHGLKSDLVAIKKMKLQKTSTGVSQETYRELLILNKLSHPGLISIYEVFQKKGSIYIVMEYIQDDLGTISQKTNLFLKDPLYMKEIMRKLLETLDFMHSRGFLHRDIKPANVLIRDNTVKLIDFGLSKYCHNKLIFSSNVCSIWYRAPELLMGCNNYGAEIDVWSAGLVMAEMMLGQPLLAGTCELEQLGLIFGVLGTPEYHGWEDAKNLKNYCVFKSSPGRQLGQVFLNSGEVQIDLFKKMCEVNPKKRITVKEALKHKYFD